MAAGESEARFANLFQPSRDLAANWSVDVAQELEEYLSQLHLTPLFQDGQSCLNFAEAALLIQGSIQVYSKKVEYLYTLVLHALEFITQRKQAQQENGGASTSQENHQDLDSDEEKEEEFLNLDDVPEEANIDLNEDDVNEAPAMPNKPPASLLVVEGDAFDLVKNGGELANYQIATSFLHRDFLLLDPCDADAVDKYLNISRCPGRGTPRPPSSLRARAPRGSTPGRRASSAKKTQAFEAENEFFQAPNGPEGDDDDVEPCPNPSFDIPTCDRSDDPPAAAAEQAEENDDPWAPLNPHEPGTLPVRPYKRGQFSRNLKRAKDPFSPAIDVEFPMATKNGTTFPEFLEALQAKEAAERLKRTPRRTPFSSRSEQTKTNPRAAEEVPEQEHFNDPDDDDEPGSFEPCDFPGADDFEVPMPEAAPPEEQATNESMEKLCHAERDSLLLKVEEAQLRAELATRVSNWKVKIEKSLETQDTRPPFDIHAYGELIIEKCIQEAPKEKDAASSFTQLVKGQEKHDVARSFAALLQLVNNGNVMIQRDESVECFTAECPFGVKLLSSQRVHEEMLHYQAPSKAAGANNSNPNCGAQQGKRGKRQASTPHLTRPKSAKESFTGVENLNTTPKLTPEGKRRCKRVPLQAL